MRLSKEGLEKRLAEDIALRTVFYQQLAINVTQRLQKVSKSIADIKEVCFCHAVRGRALPKH